MAAVKAHGGVKRLLFYFLSRSPETRWTKRWIWLTKKMYWTKTWESIFISSCNKNPGAGDKGTVFSYTVTLGSVCWALKLGLYSESDILKVISHIPYESRKTCSISSQYQTVWTRTSSLCNHFFFCNDIYHSHFQHCFICYGCFWEEKASLFKLVFLKKYFCQCKSSLNLLLLLASQ